MHFVARDFSRSPSEAWRGFACVAERIRGQGAIYRPHDTMAPSFSTTKGVAATPLHIMVDRGLLDYDDKVAAHWPEFAHEGKAAITIRHVLSHQSGLYHIRQMIDDAHRMLDWDYVVHAIMPYDMRWRLGYHGVLTSRGVPSRAFGHFGFGGSGAWADPRRDLAVGLIANSGMGTPLATCASSASAARLSLAPTPGQRCTARHGAMRRGPRRRASSTG